MGAGIVGLLYSTVDTFGLIRAVQYSVLHPVYTCNVLPSQNGYCNLRQQMSLTSKKAHKSLSNHTVDGRTAGTVNPPTHPLIARHHHTSVPIGPLERICSNDRWIGDSNLHLYLRVNLHDPIL